MRLLAILVLLAACEPMNLPDKALLPTWGTGGTLLVKEVPGRLHVAGTVNLWTHPFDDDLVLTSQPGGGLQGEGSGSIYSLLNSKTGKLKSVCSLAGVMLPEPKMAPRNEGGRGEAYWDWDGTTLRLWALRKQIESCSGVTSNDTEQFDIDPFPDSAAFVPGGFITWDKGRKSLVRLHYGPLSVEPFGALPTPIMVTTSTDNRGLWAVVNDTATNSLAVYQVNGATLAVDLRMTVPMGGVFKRLALLESGVVVWQADTSWWGAAVNGAGTPFKLAITEPPSQPKAWFDGKGFFTVPASNLPGAVSVNLSNGRLHAAGIAIQNGMHVSLEAVGADKTKLTWTSNTDARGPEGGELFSEVIDAPIGLPGDGTQMQPVAFENGLCTVTSDFPAEFKPQAFKADVMSWTQSKAKVFAGPCATAQRLVTSGIVVTLQRGPLLIAHSTLTANTEAAPKYLQRPTAWALSKTGTPTPLFKHAIQFVGPNANGTMWTVTEDGWFRIDAAPLFK